MRSTLGRRLRLEDGQAVTEYAAALTIVVAIFVALTVTTNVPQVLVDKIASLIGSF